MVATMAGDILGNGQHSPSWQSWSDQRCVASGHGLQKHRARRLKHRVECLSSRTATWNCKSSHGKGMVRRRRPRAATGTCAMMKMKISWRKTWQWVVRVWFSGQGGMSGSRQKPRFAELRRYVLSDWSVHVDIEKKRHLLWKRVVFDGIIDAGKCILLFSTP